MTDHHDLITAALGRVGTSVGDVVDVCGSILDTGTPYLVGSLAQGFGNRGSDVDIHLFVPDLARATPPFLCFIGSVPVDIEHFPATLPRELSDALDTEFVAAGIGPIAVAPRLDRTVRARLTRWLTAMPLTAGPPLLDAGRRAVVEAHLMRHALTRTLIRGAIAAAAGRLDPYAWRRCGAGVLDLMCAARGWPPIGDKWLPARVRRAGIAAEQVEAADGVRDQRGLVALLDRLGVAVAEPLDLAVLRPDPDAEVVRIGRQRFVLTRFGRLEDRAPVAGGPWHEVVERVGAEEAVELLRTGLLRLELDDDSLTKGLIA
ncbi:hypothetical protein [Actinokineospora sp.]|uniref:hypothetical protein n=1 Tax=Actinokineospora sp. TaxID=1872133 RepID=UPI004037726A